MTEQVRYITPAGAGALRRELRGLWEQERPELVRRVAEAAALGDRSENAEYIYGKRQLRAIDRRIGFLSRCLDDVVVVDRPPADQRRIRFGAHVKLKQVGSKQAGCCWQIVGLDEADPAQGKISIQSPLARSMMGLSVGDQFTCPSAETPDQCWQVEQVTYLPATFAPAPLPGGRSAPT